MNNKPIPLPPEFMKIPAELQLLSNWVNWRYLPPKSSGAKWRKVPFAPNGKPANTTDRSTWSSYGDCSAAYNQGGFDGIGFVFDGEVGTDGLCYCGVDFDACVVDGKVQSLALARIKRLDTYTECSVSGTGFHCITRAYPLKRIVKFDGVEIYTNARYFTFTGRAFGTIKTAPNETNAIVEEIRAKESATKKKRAGHANHERVETAQWFDALALEQRDEVVDHALGIIAKNTQLLELGANGGNNSEYFKLTTSVARSGAPNAEDIFVKHASSAKNADPEEELRRYFARCGASQPSGDQGITVGTLILLAKQNGANFDAWMHPPQQQQPPTEASFVDPYTEFVGPEFPLEILPPTLATFVNAEHRAMGADPAAIAMAALTTVSGAINSETQVRMGEGWWEKPILWAVLVGPPSSMKSPILDKAQKPLAGIDHERSKFFGQQHKKWLQDKKIDKTIIGPVKQPRCLINDATPEKVAEILSRDPSGSLMVRDELAGWLSSFERYNSGSSRSFFLSCWNGGTFTKDRVGNGSQDANAEICVDNLALGILGGIQPDLLSTLGDLTSDGLLQRFLIVLMKRAERGNQDHPVTEIEAEYGKLIRSINGAQAQNYHFADDALEVRGRMLDYLYMLELVDGFPAPLIGAIGKLKGYFARICLVLHIARRHDGTIQTVSELDPSFTPAAGERLRRLMGVTLDDSLSAGINGTSAISRETAQMAERLIREFLLPNCFGFYDVVANGGQEREKLRSIGDFILACNKSRLRPSDFTAGVHALRGEPEQKIRDWVGRFCGMDWLVAEEGRSGAPAKAWLVVSGLREHFAKRRKQAQAARAEAHAILKAGGSRGRREDSSDKSPGAKGATI